MAHLSVKHFSALRKSFSPSRRHWRHFASRTLAMRSPGYTRRRLGGRQPLWGIGVTSAMLPILRPIAFSARTADSRPGPGPLMRTSMFLTPHSCAARPQRSAATCAANRVDMREALGDVLLALVARAGRGGLLQLLARGGVAASHSYAAFPAGTFSLT